jgi:two-component system phosphate regulon response regulator PhoB
MARLLIVEDDRDLQRILQINFELAGHLVQTAGAGGQALDQIHVQHPDLVLLDLMLPDTSGTEVCKALRSDLATRNLPIVMLTAKAEEIDRVVGLELGADDYITKPFSMRELILRVEAILRRATVTTEDDLIQFGALRIHRQAHRVWVDQQEIELTALEFRLLVTLYDLRNRVRSRMALLNAVWGVETDITTRTVDTHVKRLREKLGQAGTYVETVRGVGYRFADTPDGCTVRCCRPAEAGVGERTGLRSDDSMSDDGSQDGASGRSRAAE